MPRINQSFSLLVLILSLFSAHLVAQPSTLLEKNVVFSQLPDELGLSEPTINCILQDKEGYLWIGTWSGLIRYDGYSTKTYYSNNKSPYSLKSNKIISLLQDKEGFIWVGTHKGGLFKFDPASERFIQFKNERKYTGSISNDNVWALLEDEKGKIWIGTEKGLNIFNKENKTFEKYFSNTTDSQSLSHNFITDIHQSSSGKIWVATEYGFNRAIIGENTVSFERYINESGDQDEGLHNYIYEIDDITLQGQETLWLGSQKGLKEFKDGQIINHELEKQASGYNLFRTVLTIKGERPIILAGSESGLNIFDPRENTFINLLRNDQQQANLTHGTVTSIYLDQSQVLWVGTKKGLSKYDTYSKNFNFFKSRSFDPTESIITGIRESKKGHYWIGTMGGGLYKFKGGEIHSYDNTSLYQRFKIKSNKKNDFTDFIQTLYTDSKGNIWIGTAGDGIYSFNENKIDFGSNKITNYQQYNLKSQPSISDDYVMSITEGSDEAIWVGMWSGGLNKITSAGEVKIYNDSLLLQAPLVVLHLDSRENLWVGTRGNGLYRIKEKQDGLNIKKFNIQEGLENLFVNAVYEDQKNTLWVGTEDGLYFMDEGSDQIQRYNLRSEMDKEVIVGILGDQKGRLWLSHWGGLTVIKPNQLSAMMRHFDRQDHIQGGFYYNNSSIKDSYGNLIFGGSNGFNIINPEEDYINPVKPKVAIAEIQINNRPVKVGEEFNGRILLEDGYNKEELVLNHSENSLSFEFAALHFAAPEKIKYAYKLDGFDDSWHYIDSDRRFANYTNLPAGNYQFLVNATNNDGIWSDKYSYLSFAISPPWWKTNWAIALYTLFFIFILYSFRKIIIIRTNFMNNLKLERMERANVENINKSKLEFFTNISHEFRTPLTLISGPLQRIKDAGITDNTVRQHLNIIDNNTQRLLRLVNQLLDFRKAESGNFNLEVAKGDILKFIREVKLSFEGLASQKNVNFQLKAEKEKIIAWFDRDQFEKILYNLIYNAFKNTPVGGTISIEVIEEQEEVLIAVSDNGKGIKSQDLEHIFQRFFSSNNPDHSPGSGIGLTLTKSLVELHGGTIEVESSENEFTRFLVRIPKGHAHFKNENIVSDFLDSEEVKRYAPLHVKAVSDELNVGSPEKKNNLYKILIVEDNDEVRAYIKSIFTENYTVVEAINGKEGLEKAKEELPEIIISDVMMPVMDGIKLCKEIKKDLRTSHIPVIMLTARTPLIFRVEGLKTGADDYITKPFDPKTLELKVKNFIKLREAIRNTFKNNTVLEIEPSKITLTSADEVFINNALKSIEDNMDNSEYSVEDLAAAVCFSRMQLYRKIKSLTGQSANEFIRTIRLKRAAQFLEQNELTVAEVTYRVGFSDLKYFRVCFKKQFGVNPSNYSVSEKHLEVDENNLSS